MGFKEYHGHCYLTFPAWSLLCQAFGSVSKPLSHSHTPCSHHTQSDGLISSTLPWPSINYLSGHSSIFHTMKFMLGQESQCLPERYAKSNNSLTCLICSWFSLPLLIVEVGVAIRDLGTLIYQFWFHSCFVFPWLFIFPHGHFLAGPGGRPSSFGLSKFS